jgi:hypothetical protein
MVGPSEVDESRRLYSSGMIEEALKEAFLENYREPKTNIWKSFWDRLSEGHYCPPDPMDQGQV